MARMFGHDRFCPCCPVGMEAVLPRRGFLAAAVGVAAAGLSAPALAQALAPVRRLNVRRQVTEDSFNGVYFRDGRYVRDALRSLDFVFRDLSAAETTPMDPRLFDVMFVVARRLDADEPFQVISGYRTPETNARNASRSRRVSSVSLHMSGMAADCRLPGYNSLGMARTAADLQLGGVGLYRSDGFIHLDCGPVRRW
jgi:uncharacterized protein YcbK (DUF882 family)